MTSVWEGQRVRLRGVEPRDWEAFYHLDQDSEMQRLGDLIYPPRSREATRAWAEEEATKRFAHDGCRFAIENREGILVGTLLTLNCNQRQGTFSYGLGLGREHWRQGYATEAIALVLRYYFQELRYQKANATVYSFNEASVALHEKLGFTPEGRLRRMGYTGGRYYDHLLYGMTAEEFGQHFRFEPSAP